LENSWRILLFLDIQDPKDWNKVSVIQVAKSGGAGLLSRYNNSLKRALRSIYPNLRWSPDQHLRQGRSITSKTQYFLYSITKQLFPTLSIEVNFQFANPIQKRRALELDIFIPDLALAIEYNGEYHYRQLAIHPTFKITQQRDKLKKLHCQEEGITLIVIPYWWDKTIDSVIQTIHQLRPDIDLPDAKGFPIPAKIPK